MGDYSWVFNLILFLMYLYIPYMYVKFYTDGDKEIATIIRCQKSIEYLKAIKDEGYIDYDTKLDQKFKEIEPDLSSKLKAAREERKKYSNEIIYVILNPPIDNSFDFFDLTGEQNK